MLNYQPEAINTLWEVKGDKPCLYMVQLLRFNITENNAHTPETINFYVLFQDFFYCPSFYFERIFFQF